MDKEISLPSSTLNMLKQERVNFIQRLKHIRWSIYNESKNPVEIGILSGIQQCRKNKAFIKRRITTVEND